MRKLRRAAQKRGSARATNFERKKQFFAEFVIRIGTAPFGAPFSYSKGNKFREEIRFSALLCLILSFVLSGKKRINAQIEARSAEARFCSRYKFLNGKKQYFAEFVIRIGTAPSGAVLL